MHAGAPPPDEKLAVPDDYGAESEGIASSSWWDMMSLTIFGKKVSNEQAKKIIYVGAAALVFVTLLLIISVSGGDDAAAAGGGGAPVRNWGGNWGGEWSEGQGAALGRDPATAVFVSRSNFRGRDTEGTPTSLASGSECKVAMPPGRDCTAAAGGRCGLTSNNELYAWLMDAPPSCGRTGADTRCEYIIGPLVRYGCSRAELSDGRFVECCVATGAPDVVDCANPVPDGDFAAQFCRTTVGNRDSRSSAITLAGQTISCASQCADSYAPTSCEYCLCSAGCEASTGGQSFESCTNDVCSPPVGSCDRSCDLDACNAGCAIPYNPAYLSPPALRFEFNGNLRDTSGNNHGISHFNPDSRTLPYGTGHDGSENGALVFDNNDYVTLRSPFPSQDTEFTLAVWLAPREVIFPGWHAFVGFQNGGVCPGRSPSMWVDGGGHGDNPPGVHKGLHYDSCDESTSTRYAGVLENFFTTPGEYVHVVWTKQGNQYYFYKNGQPVEGSWRAPDRVQLSDQYNIGHNDNYFDGKIDEVAFFDFALSPTEVAALFHDQNTVTFNMRTNEGPSPEYSNVRVGLGQECQLHWSAGGCGGIDAGRCGVTQSGELYAWYLDAVAWCADVDPFCGFVMGEPVRTGCSRAERVGYFVECCVREADADTRMCGDVGSVVNWEDDATASCTESSGNGQRDADCDAQCVANYQAGTQEMCACQQGCAAARSGQNFESCQNGCSSRQDPLTATCNAEGSGRSDWCTTPAACADACNFGCSVPFRRIPTVVSMVGLNENVAFTSTTSSGGAIPHMHVDFGSECPIPSTSSSTQCPSQPSKQAVTSGRCGATSNGQLYAWILDGKCTDDQPECSFSMGPLVREGCSRAKSGNQWVECCHRLGGDTSDTGTAACGGQPPVSWATDPSAHCSHSQNENVCDRVRPILDLAGDRDADHPDRICHDNGNSCEFFVRTSGKTCSEKCAEANLVCQNGWDDDPGTADDCDRHFTWGTDRSDTQVDETGSHVYGTGGCANPYGNQICICTATSTCAIDMEYGFSWVDITGTGTQITDWTQNADDGWYHIDLGFPFTWFGDVQHTATVSTNGFLTFGTQGLRNGATEPVPCHWDASPSSDIAAVGCIDPNTGESNDYGSGHNGVGVDGVIAVYWSDMTTDAGKGRVFYQTVQASNPAMVAWNKLIVQWDAVEIWNAPNSPNTFEVILFGDGTVTMQYQQMSQSVSWSRESIGFEDKTGEHGVQISYGSVPADNTAYNIPASCHVDHVRTGTCTPTRYELSPVELPWGSAEDYCVNHGGHLASVHSREDQRALEILIGDHCTEGEAYRWSGGETCNWDSDSVWIGMHDIHSEAGCNADAFVWTDGTHTDFAAWSNGEPNDWLCGTDGTVGGSGDQCIAVCDDVNLVGMGEDCVTTMPSRSHQWNDQECTIAHRFMCGFCGGGVAKPTHFTYTDESLTQMAAEDACIARGGHLASAHGQHDADIWDQLIPANTEVWIGFHDRDMEAGCDGDKFRWTDGTETDFTNWSQGEPNDWLCADGTDLAPAGGALDVGERCMGMCDQADSASGQGLEDCCATTGGEGHTWNDDRCLEEKPYLCGFSTANRRPASFTFVPAKDEGERTTQRMAEVACTRMGGHLASIHSDADQEKVFSLSGMEAAGQKAWIGLHDRDLEAGCDGSSFSWIDGTINDYGNWSKLDAFPFCTRLQSLIVSASQILVNRTTGCGKIAMPSRSVALFVSLT